VPTWRPAEVRHRLQLAPQRSCAAGV